MLHTFLVLLAHFLIFAFLFVSLGVIRTIKHEENVVTLVLLFAFFGSSLFWAIPFLLK